MFCGIVEQTSIVLYRNGGEFVVQNNFQESLSLWQSIAHDGACMTITWQGESRKESGKAFYTFFVMEESMKKTNLDTKKSWDIFNVELCMKIGDRLDGHMVSWHIDTTAKVIKIKKNEDNSWSLSVSIHQQYYKLMIPKWSITINGVSLTIVNCDNMDIVSGYTICTVCLIPYTRIHTNLSQLSINNLVNIEFDMIGKYLLRSH